MTDPVKAIADRWKRVERAQKQANRSPQLHRSSTEGGAQTVYQPGTGGLPGAIIGRQFDGTYGAVAVGGPNPPAPTGITVEALPSAIRVTWDGSFVDDADTPMDWTRAEVRVSQQDDLDGLTQPLSGAFVSPSGGDLTVNGLTPGVPLYVRVTSRTTTGKTAPSAILGPVTPLTWAKEALDVDFDTFGGTTIFYGTEEPDTDRADLWLKEVDPGPPPQYETWRYNPLSSEWEQLNDTGAANALAAALAAQQAADAKAQVFYEATEPAWEGGAGSAVWFDTGNGNRPHSWDGTEFVERRLGNGAIQPQSLIASNVFATGTVTAALLEAVLVLATTIVIGPVDGPHVEITPTGVYTYAVDAATGELYVAGRQGTGTDDHFGVADATGTLVSSMDSLGGVNGRVGRFESLEVGGVSLDDRLATVVEPAGHFREIAPAIYFGAYYGPIQSRVGVAEVISTGELIAGHDYEIPWQCVWQTDVAGDDAVFSLHVSAAAGDTAPAPLVSDPAIETWVWPSHPTIAQRWQTASATGRYTATVTGRHRFLLSMARGAGGGSVMVISDAQFPVSMDIVSRGPSAPNTGQFSQGGGTFFGGSAPPPPPQPTQQYDTGFMQPAGWRTFRGDGSERFDVGGPVQGWDPSGFNGDGGGFWWWDLPAVTGTVTEVGVYLWAEHWFYNSGGIARINMIPSGATGGFDAQKLSGYHLEIAGSKPGPIQFSVPADWRPYFSSSPPGGVRAIGISVGRVGSTNPTYYGRFNGPAAQLRFVHVA